ncbi:hypothetical protein MLD38_018567 [Melastoma candidum]|uniref:Uncharacterized protein n=1 Tax=Melastoma candidum TaxID=119954 RepID=A0ACB9QVA7_9MYRT|nr:hypothetical protein MLD38_018567 [Melastoma candidum]
MKRNYRCSKALQQFYSGGPFAVSSDASFLACACDSSINLVDALNSSIRSRIDCGSDVTAISLSPDDRVLFAADHSRQIRVWEVSTSTCLRSWKTRMKAGLIEREFSRDVSFNQSLQSTSANRTRKKTVYRILQPPPLVYPTSFTSNTIRSPLLQAALNSSFPL